MSDGDLPAPAPSVSPETAAFWEAAAEGRLLVGHCTDCGHDYFYPRRICPACHGLATELREASGRGTVYTYTVVRQGRPPFDGATPYVLAYVELEEGPRVLTNVVDTPVEDVEVGQAVEVTFDATGEGTALPRFRPV